MLLGWKVVSVFTPREKLLKYIGGTVCGNPAGPEGLIPSVPAPVTKPKVGKFCEAGWRLVRDRGGPEEARANLVHRGWAERLSYC